MRSLNLNRTILFFLISLFLITSCRSGDPQADRNPAQARAFKIQDMQKLNPEQLSEELISQARLMRQLLSYQQSFRAQLLNHFIDSSARRKARYPKDSFRNILGIYNAFEEINKHPQLAPLMENLSPQSLEVFESMGQIAKLIESKGASDSESLRVFKIAGDVSFLRFLTNRTIDQTKKYVDLLPRSAQKTEIIRVHNQFIKLKGNIAYLSKAMNSEREFSTHLNYILRSPLWPNMKKVYIPLAGSSDLEGMEKDLEMAEGIRLGYDTILALTESLSRQPALQKPVNAKAIEQFENERMPAQVEADDVISEVNTKMPEMKYAHLVLIGQIPGQYLNLDKSQTYLGKVEIKNRLITEVKQIAESDIPIEKSRALDRQVVVLKNGQSYDVIYPGLIDLHNHTKQNNLPVWSLAQGQFENRFEWRGWGDYTKSVSQNMNPWIGFGKPIECAAFRWSELQAMVLGTTYLQGPSNCVENFAIQRVEDGKAYISQKASVQAPTDLIYPNEMQFVWSELRPEIQRGSSYEQALANSIKKYCPSLGNISASDVNQAAGLKILKDQALLKANCPEPLPKGFIRYIYWIHPTVAGKKNYLLSPNSSAVIAHLAEGRRQDPYNKREMELIQLLGLDLPKLNFVHGVGIEPQFLSRIANQKMGLIWSPFSNLLLYAETLDILAAHRAKVLLALGSDWLPTGSKTVLEEVKLAAQYVDKDPQLKSVFTDEELFKMMTENPARMIGHWDIQKTSSGVITEAGVGQLAVGAMGSVIVASNLDSNPYTNLVRKAQSENVNLVVIDGNIVYGDENYVREAGIQNFETISDEFMGIEKSIQRSAVPVPSLESGKEIVTAHLEKIGQYAARLKPPVAGNCQFKQKKVFVTPDTVRYQSDLEIFRRASGIDLDRFVDLKKLLAVSAMTQSRNLIDPKGDPTFALKYFPPLYSCNDAAHTARIQGMVKSGGSDEWAKNVSQRNSLRLQQKLGRIPQNLGTAYK